MAGLDPRKQLAWRRRWWMDDTSQGHGYLEKLPGKEQKFARFNPPLVAGWEGFVYLEK